MVFFDWWGWMGSNHRPTGYEPAALTPELHPRGYTVHYSALARC